MSEAVKSLSLPHGSVEVDVATGALSSIHLDTPETRFVTPKAGAGLVRVAAPLGHYQSHFLECGTHGSPSITEDGDRLLLNYESLTSTEGTFPIEIDITLRPSEDGLVLSATVHNGWDQPLPQIFFPQLMDLEAVGGEADTRLQLGRHQMAPFQKLAMTPENARWMDGPLNEYFPYGDFKFNMKWLDYGDSERGLTLYSRNTRHTTQGLVIQRVDRSDSRLNVRWAHYPPLDPGETWESGEYVLLPHSGDWYAGARAYKQFTDAAYPYNAPRRIQEALAVRSIWAAPRNAPPNLQFAKLPEYAEEIADPDLGIAELIMWHWWYRNGYPITVDPRIGTESELAEALKRCEEIGVPIVLFVSHHILRDTDETDRDWVHLNAGDQAVINNWTYGRDFLPMFRPPFSGTHAMVNGSALSPEWRRIGLEAYAHFLELGGKGICFDVGRAWEDPNFNPSIDGQPDEEGEKLLEFARQARDLIHAATPEGSYSAEHVSDVNVPVLDYTWEWFNGADIVEAAPFRYVFPQFRLNANVNEHPRGALYAFMEGALLNVMPGNMNSFRLRDCPELVAMLRQLAKLRQQFLPFFTDGQFHFREGLTVNGGEGRLYRRGSNILVVVANPTDDTAEVTIEVDPTVWGGRASQGTVTAVDLDGHVTERTEGESSALRRQMRLGPDSLRIYAIEGLE